MNAAAIPVLRIARGCLEPFALARQYCEGLKMVELSRFVDHDGFDGVMLGQPQSGWHLEFVRAPQPAAHGGGSEDALVLYVGSEALPRWQETALAAGFVPAGQANPYWRRHGVTLADREGGQVVLAALAWTK